MRNNYKDNYIVIDATAEDDELLMENFKKGKVHPEFLPMTTYDMVQSGYPEPDHGEMVVRVHGGYDEDGVLQPSHGMWIKREDFLTFLIMSGNMEIIRRTNTMHLLDEIQEPVKSSKVKKKKATSKKKKVVKK
jgi:hypothetical protein